MSAVRLPLERPKDKRHSKIHWNECAPFVLNDRAVLVHRPRVVTIYNGYSDGRAHKAHIAVWFYCGNTALGPRDLTFTSELPEEAIVCHRCELIAVSKELPPSSHIAGHHVHIGGLRAYKLCCPEPQLETTNRHE